MSHPLTIDHLYISLSPSKFEALRPSLINHYGAIYQKHIPSDATNGWEGLYIYTTEGTYFEVLLNTGEGYNECQIGVALSSRDASFNTAAYCRATFPDCIEDRVKSSKGEPWFTSFSKKDVPERPKAFVWVMAYEAPFKEERFVKKPEAKIESFKHIKMLISKEAMEELQTFSDWLPPSNLFSVVAANEDEFGFDITT